MAWFGSLAVQGVGVLEVAIMVVVVVVVVVVEEDR
jgi:hypothetical protein